MAPGGGAAARRWSANRSGLGPSGQSESSSLDAGPLRLLDEPVPVAMAPEPSRPLPAPAADPLPDPSRPGLSPPDEDFAPDDAVEVPSSAPRSAADVVARSGS